MNKNPQKFIIALLITLVVFLPLVAADDQVVLNFYFSSSCHSCDAYKPVIRQIEENYTGKVIVHWKDVGGPQNQENYTEWKSYGFSTYPSAVINNETKVKKENLTRENLDVILESYIDKITVENTASPFQIIINQLIVHPQPLPWAILIIFVLLAIGLSITPWRKYKQKHKNPPKNSDQQPPVQ